MNIPSLSCKIEMFCTVNPSESIEKIEKAISNIFPYSIINNNNLTIHASTDTRFSFLQKRGRSDDPQTKEHFDERDNREMGVGISNSIALSDYAISNIGLTKNELIKKSYEIIQRWIE